MNRLVLPLAVACGLMFSATAYAGDCSCSGSKKAAARPFDPNSQVFVQAAPMKVVPVTTVEKRIVNVPTEVDVVTTRQALVPDCEAACVPAKKGFFGRLEDNIANRQANRQADRQAAKAQRNARLAARGQCASVCATTGQAFVLAPAEAACDPTPAAALAPAPTPGASDCDADAPRPKLPGFGS